MRKVALVAAVLVLAGCGTTTQATAPPQAGSATGSRGQPNSDGLTCGRLPGRPGPVPFTPYTDVTISPQLSVSNVGCATGTREFTTGFFQGPASGGGCEPNLAGAPYENPALQADVQHFRGLGGDAIGSFGGQAGQELAQTCRSEPQLEAAYQRVVDYYGFRQLDFDLEGGAATSPSTNTLRADALADLQRQEAGAGRRVNVSLTLPVLPTGLPPSDVEVVQSTVDAGVTLGLVNVLAMDYGDAVAPNPAGRMASYAIQSASVAGAQLAPILGHSSQPMWSRLGVTPMIGQNDTRDEVFTLGDANQLASWARSHRIGRLAMWSANRDATCPGKPDGASDTCSGVQQAPWAYSKTFSKA